MANEAIELSIHSIGPKITLSISLRELTIDQRMQLLMNAGDSLGLWSRLPTFASVEVDKACRQIREEADE